MQLLKIYFNGLKNFESNNLGQHEAHFCTVWRKPRWQNQPLTQIELIIRKPHIQNQIFSQIVTKEKQLYSKFTDQNLNHFSLNKKKKTFGRRKQTFSVWDWYKESILDWGVMLSIKGKSSSSSLLSISRCLGAFLLSS